MSKIRTVKPELFRHEQLFEAEQKSGFPLRLVFIGLFTAVDAEGSFRWRPRQLKLDILPYDEINFGAVLSALVECGFVQRYECDGEYYGYIPTWRRHQSINQREPDSILPDPQCCTAMRAPAPGYAASIMSRDRNMSTQVTHMPAQPSVERPVESSRVMPTAAELNAHDQKENFAVRESIKTLQTGLVEPRTCTHMQDLSQPMHPQAETVRNKVAHMPASLEMEMEVEMEREVEVEGCGEAKEGQPAQPQLTLQAKPPSHGKPRLIP